MIKRRRPPSYLSASHHHHNHQQAVGSYLEVGHFGGLDEELDRLRRDKNVLLAEVVKLRQEHQSTKADLRAMEERLQRAETRQVQMMGFLVWAMQNPNFFRQLLVQSHDRRRKELEDAVSDNKRRRPIDIVPFTTVTAQRQGEEPGSSTTFLYGPSGRELEELSEPGNSELEDLALNIQGLGKRKQDDEQAAGGSQDDNNNEVGGETAELTDDFWEELLNEGVRSDGELSVTEMTARRRSPPGRYVGALAQKMSYLSNSTAK